ncbi:MAG: hypothetical protein GX569_03165 [Candidatus Riflebacteria bacterium]|nr:hypothetical protein [Candidatus Riflebacteria bacterium]
MNKSRRGAISHLVMAAVLSLFVVLIAVFLSGLHSSAIVPAISLINADYQTESAIIMQLQKAHFNPSLPEQSLKKEIMPGVMLKLHGAAAADGNWTFKGSITGNQLNKTFSAIANINHPDQINFTSYSQSE